METNPFATCSNNPFKPSTNAVQAQPATVGEASGSAGFRTTLHSASSEFKPSFSTFSSTLKPDGTVSQLNPFAATAGPSPAEMVGQQAPLNAPAMLGATEFKPSASAFVATSAPVFMPSQAQPFLPSFTLGGPVGMNEDLEYGMEMYEMEDCKYKTQICRNWLETAHCRFESKCRFAHGQEELQESARFAYSEKFKSKNCRTFYQTKYCSFGDRCLFRHEHRHLRQLHRHFYTPHLFMLEALFAGSADEAAFVASYESPIHRLQAFQTLHDGFEEGDASEVDSEDEYMQLLEKTFKEDLLGDDDEGKDTDPSSTSSLNTTSDSIKEERSSTKLSRGLSSPFRASDSEGSDVGSPQRMPRAALSSPLGLRFD